MQQPLLIGWKERIDFPEWGIHQLSVKIDTGAHSSALGVLHYELKEVPGQGLLAQIHMPLSRKSPNRVTVFQAAVLRHVVVRSSIGVRETRPLIEATVQLGPLLKRIRLTLTNRSTMRFPMLLGRTALTGDFVVDVSRKYLLQEPESGMNCSIRRAEPR